MLVISKQSYSKVEGDPQVMKSSITEDCGLFGVTKPGTSRSSRFLKPLISIVDVCVLVCSVIVSFQKLLQRQENFLL